MPMPSPILRRARGPQTDGSIAATLALTCWLLLCGFWVGTATGAPSQSNGDIAQLNQLFPQSKLQIATPDARIHSFNIWLALDDPHRERGLMYVQNLPDDRGMLFVYPAPRVINMWMKNTFVPLDMIFIDQRGKVRQVAENTTPQSLSIISSREAVYAVLEVKAGTAKRLRIGPGAIITHQLFEQHSP
jgi:uncharacterized protein